MESESRIRKRGRPRKNSNINGLKFLLDGGVTKKRCPLTKTRRQMVSFFTKHTAKNVEFFGYPESRLWITFLVNFINNPSVTAEAIENWLEREPDLIENFSSQKSRKQEKPPATWLQRLHDLNPPHVPLEEFAVKLTPSAAYRRLSLRSNASNQAKRDTETNGVVKEQFPPTTARGSNKIMDHGLEKASTSQSSLQEKSLNADIDKKVGGAGQKTLREEEEPSESMDCRLKIQKMDNPNHQPFDIATPSPGRTQSTPQCSPATGTELNEEILNQSLAVPDESLNNDINMWTSATFDHSVSRDGVSDSDTTTLITIVRKEVKDEIQEIRTGNGSQSLIGELPELNQNETVKIATEDAAVVQESISPVIPNQIAAPSPQSQLCLTPISNISDIIDVGTDSTSYRPPVATQIPLTAEVQEIEFQNGAELCQSNRIPPQCPPQAEEAIFETLHIPSSYPQYPVYYPTGNYNSNGSTSQFIYIPYYPPPPPVSKIDDPESRVSTFPHPVYLWDLRMAVGNNNAALTLIYRLERNFTNSRTAMDNLANFSPYISNNQYYQ